MYDLFNWSSLVSFITGGAILRFYEVYISKKSSDAGVFKQMQDSYANFLADHKNQISDLRNFYTEKITEKDSKIQQLQVFYTQKIDQLEKDINNLKKALTKCSNCIK